MSDEYKGVIYVFLYRVIGLNCRLPDAEWL